MTSTATQLGLRVLNRSPPQSTKLDGSVAIELGKVIEFVAGNAVIRMGRSRPALLWFPAWKALAFFEGVSSSRASAAALKKLSEETATTRAGNTFEKWARRDATKARSMTFPGGARKWYGGETVHRLDYWSDKWNDADEYTHDFGKGVKLYVLSSKKSHLWLIRGGKMTVTARGIVR